MSKQRTFAKLVAEGYTIAGGMWGTAAWKRLSPTLVVAIGQAQPTEEGPVTGIDLDDQENYYAAPENETDPCMIFLYRGAISPKWNINHGECPFAECYEPILAELIRAASLPKALLKVQAIEEFESLLARTFEQIDGLS